MYRLGNIELFQAAPSRGQKGPYAGAAYSLDDLSREIVGALRGHGSEADIHGRIAGIEEVGKRGVRTPVHALRRETSSRSCGCPRSNRPGGV